MLPECESVIEYELSQSSRTINIFWRLINFDQHKNFSHPCFDYNSPEYLPFNPCYRYSVHLLLWDKYVCSTVTSVYCLKNRESPFHDVIPFGIYSLTPADVPDLKTFLEKIGRNAAAECEDKIHVHHLSISVNEDMERIISI